jgi:fibronectin type III domain protein
MLRRIIFALILLAGIAVFPSRAENLTHRKVRLFRVTPAKEPLDLSRPEGKSRWDLANTSREETFLRTLDSRDGRVTVTEESTGKDRPSSTRMYSDPSGGTAAQEWLFPDRDPSKLRPGTVRDFVLDEEEKGNSNRLHIHAEVVGIGWAHLPSQPFEVVLQRCLFQRDGGEGARSEVLYRWISNLSGVVAESHAPAAGGVSPADSRAGAILDAVIEGADTTRIYVSQIYSPPFSDIGYGWDRTPKACSVTTSTACTKNSDCPGNEFCSFPLSSLTTPSFATMGDLLAPSTWDFSVNNSGTEVSGTTVNMSSAETCNSTRCGYTGVGAVLERLDSNFPNPASTVKTNDVIVLENRPTDTTIWVRGGSQKEGLAGSLGEGEGRFCYETFGGVTRTPVPLYRFTHQDAPGQEYYMVAGDTWSSGKCSVTTTTSCTQNSDCPASQTCIVFNCEQNIFNQVCGAPQLFDTLYSKSCTNSGGHTGTQSTTALKGGVVTTPSGHTFNVLLLRVTADFCVYTGSSCSLFVADEVRTFTYLWQVPFIGTVVRLTSEQNAANGTTFTRVAETDIRFGLFPPRSMMVTGQTQTTVSLSWDPGLDTHRINGYKIYWDTDSGSSTAYAFNSVANAGQVSFAGTTATISGLTPGTNYYFTVTSLSNWTDPSTLVVHSYESLLYPTQVSGDPAFIYPVEVLGATTPSTCIPTAEVTNLTVNHTAVVGEIQICWTPVTDACLTGYRVLSSNTASSDAGFGTAANVGSGTTCWTGSPSEIFYLVVANGTGGTGPWGHYGH